MGTHKELIASSEVQWKTIVLESCEIFQKLKLITKSYCPLALLDSLVGSENGGLKQRCMPQIKLLKSQWNILLALWLCISALLAVTMRHSKNEVEWDAEQGELNWKKKHTLCK